MTQELPTPEEFRKIMDKIEAQLPLELYACEDCGLHTMAMGEYYMIDDALWTFGNIMLCIGCLEERLGFTLKGEHFPAIPINQGVFHQSNRLRSRIKGTL